MIGIYKITSPNNRVYIGQSVNIEKRINHYKKYSTSKNQIRLYNSFLKYGVINHKFEIVEECLFEDLNIRERYWQDYYDVIGKQGLNCRLTKTEDKKGFFSQESRNKLSNSKKGIKVNNDALKGIVKYRKENINFYYNKFRGEAANIKLVLNIQTGIFYDCAKDAAEVHNIKYQTLIRKLNGNRKNNTNLKYI